MTVFKIFRPVTVALAVLLIVVLHTSSTHACPGCNAGLDSTLGSGFNTSILFLMSMPFFVVAAIVGGIIFIRRKNHLSNSESNQTKEK